MMNKYPSLLFVWFVVSLPLRTLFLTIRYSIIGLSFKKYQNSLVNHLKFSIFRSGLDYLNVGDFHFISLYKIGKSFAQFQAKFPQIVAKLNGYGQEYDTHSTWVVKSSLELKNSSDPILIYLHGGAYRLQLRPSQLETLISTYCLLNGDKRSNLSVLVLDYSLCSLGHPFPKPVEDLHETYQRLTAGDGNTNIIFLGDSAGGNLALVYLQYLKKLNLKDVIYPSNMLLVAPWLRAQATSEQYVPGHSWYDNQPRDLLQYSRFSSPSITADTFGDSDVKSVLTSPLLTPFNLDDWTDIPTINKNILILCGEYESFRDDILEFSKYLFGCPFYKQNSLAYNASDGTYKPGIHEFQADTKNGSVGFKLFMEPLGIHDSTFILETAIAKLTEDEQIKIEELDDENHFGIKRMAQFLNEVL